MRARCAYTAKAWDVLFEDGNGRFSGIIRQPDSWREATALQVLRAYEGRAVLAVPGTDAAIPPAVTEAVQDALTARAQYTRFVLPDAQHQLGMWFRDHGDDRREFVLTGLVDRGWKGTRAWVAKQLGNDRSVADFCPRSGSWSPQMRRLTLDDGTDLGQRTFVKPFFRRHGPGLLAREASVLALLAGQEGMPAPVFVAVDATAEHCDHPTLLMSALPGSVRLDQKDLGRRLDLLAAQLVRVHGVVPAEGHPDGPLWERAVDMIRRDPPPYEGCFLHRDFHPGNVLFTGALPGLGISGVVDWVETSWGPADLDVAHCSTALALLHGQAYGLDFCERYEAHGGRELADDPTTCTGGCSTPLHYCPDARSWPARGVTWGGTI